MVFGSSTTWNNPEYTEEFVTSPSDLTLPLLQVLEKEEVPPLTQHAPRKVPRRAFQAHLCASAEASAGESRDDRLERACVPRR